MAHGGCCLLPAQGGFPLPYERFSACSEKELAPGLLHAALKDPTATQTRARSSALRTIQGFEARPSPVLRRTISDSSWSTYASAANLGREAM